ncbi:MAG: hypothetical protein ABH886_04095 [Candidatus Desantisbacteria bacterium]
MRKSIIFLSIFFITCFSFIGYTQTGTEKSLKYISGYEMDFNNDTETDIVFLTETLAGQQLIVLMKTKKGYNTYVISKGKSNMQLSCHFGKYLKETTAGRGKGRIYKTLGAYIQLSLPECSSVAYFWNGKGFTEVWTSD